MTWLQRTVITVLAGLTAMLCGCMISVIALNARVIARYFSRPDIPSPPAVYALPIVVSPSPLPVSSPTSSPTPPSTPTVTPSPTPTSLLTPAQRVAQGEVYLAQRDYAAAVAEFDVGIESGGADSEEWLARAYLGRGVAHFHLGEWNAAWADFDAAAALDPRLADAYAWRGYILSEQRQYTLALAELRRAVALDSGDPRKHIRLADALLGSQQPRAALDEYTTALTLAPYDIEAHAGVARSAAELGDFALVTRHLAHMTSIAPYDPTALNTRAWIYARYQQEHLFEAEQLARQAADRSRDDRERARCLYTLSWAYAQQGRYQEAIAALEEAAARAQVEGRVIYTEIPALRETLQGEPMQNR